MTIDIRRRDDGTLRYRVRVVKHGKLVGSKTFRLAADAKRYESELSARSYQTHVFADAEARRHTFGDAVDWCLKHRVNTYAVSHRATVKRMWEFWKKRLGHIRLSDFHPQMLAQEVLRADLHEKSDSTQAGYLAKLSLVFSIAIRKLGWLQDNPARNLERPPVGKGRLRILDEPEQRKLLAACRASRRCEGDLFDVVVLALATGGRLGELAALEWQHVDLKAGTVRFVDTKNGDSRSLRVTGAALDILKRRRAVPRLDTPLVFPGSRDPKKPRTKSIGNSFTKVVDKCGLVDFHFHDLRHCFASALAAGGASTLQIAAALGHRQLAMVKRYSHLTTQHVAQSATLAQERLLADVTA